MLPSITAIGSKAALHVELAERRLWARRPSALVRSAPPDSGHASVAGTIMVVVVVVVELGWIDYGNQEDAPVLVITIG